MGMSLLYQSPFTPFDLSAPAFDRAMSNLRARGGQLIFFDAADCALIGGTVAGQGPGRPIRHRCSSTSGEALGVFRGARCCHRCRRRPGRHPG